MVTKFDENFPFSIEQESLNQFYAEMKKTKNKKFKKKVKKKCSNKKLKVNKIKQYSQAIDIKNQQVFTKYLLTFSSSTVTGFPLSVIVDSDDEFSSLPI